MYRVPHFSAGPHFLFPHPIVPRRRDGEIKATGEFQEWDPKVRRGAGVRGAPRVQCPLRILLISLALAARVGSGVARHVTTTAKRNRYCNLEALGYGARG